MSHPPRRQCRRRLRREVATCVHRLFKDIVTVIMVNGSHHHTPVDDNNDGGGRRHTDAV